MLVVDEGEGEGVVTVVSLCDSGTNMREEGMEVTLKSGGAQVGIAVAVEDCSAAAAAKSSAGAGIIVGK